MKHVVSVSLGSSRRDHCVEAEVLGEKFRIERIGTDGDMEKAIKIISDLDGKIDAFGMGGIDLFFVAGKKKHILRDAKRIAAAARQTPMVDGSGLKNTLERRTVYYLAEHGLIDFEGCKVLMVCGVDRFGMAEALVEKGADVTFGDLIFSLNIPMPIRSLPTLTMIANILGPVVSRLPFKYLYPTGDKQEVITEKYSKYYSDNEIIAGDFHFIRRYLPAEVRGKTILTNTVTKDDIKQLALRGVKRLITSTPEFEGRSFGTNVMEALLITLLDKPVHDICEEDYNRILDQVGFTPRIIDLQEAASA